MWKIDKEFNFEYAHRVWNQSLDPELSNNSECKCKFIHGHSGKIKIGLLAQYLNEGMVTDFNELKWFKTWLDDTLDHKTILDINDPLFKHFIPETLGFYEFDGYKTVNINPHHFLYELYGSYVIVDFVPTSENFCKWIFDMVKKRMPEVAFVDFNETVKSHSRYEE